MSINGWLWKPGRSFIQHKRAREGVQVTKVVFGKFCGLTDALVGDKEGRFPISEEIDAHWAEHFGEVLDRLLPTAEVDNKEAEHDLQVNTAPPEKEEIISAIKSLKDRNAPRAGQS